MKRRLSHSSDRNCLLSQFDLFFLNFIRLPDDIIELILTYIRKDHLGFFLDCYPLVKFIIPYLKEKVTLVKSFWNLSEPLNAKRFEIKFLNCPMLLVEELQEFAIKYDFHIKEVNVLLSYEIASLYLKLKEEPKTKKKKIPKKVLKKDESGVYYVNPSREDVREWVEYYSPLMKRIKWLNISDDSDTVDFYLLLLGVWSYSSVGSLMVNIDFKSSDRAKGILLNLPTGLNHLELYYRGIVTERFYTHFENLKELIVEIMFVTEFKTLPDTLEMLQVEELHEGGLLRNYKTPENLKYFKANVSNSLKNYLLLIREMKNLEVLKIISAEAKSLEEFGLNESKITCLKFGYCCYLNDYSALLRFPKLKKLSMDNSKFPDELFHDGSNLPSLREFKYVNDDPLGCDFNLDKIKFPDNLSTLKLQGAFQINNWKIPLKLNRLELYFPNFLSLTNFKLPPNLVYFKIADSDVENLDNLQFPTGLITLIIIENEELTSMVNTNLVKLTELKNVGIFYNNKSMVSDEPNKDVKCWYNSFTMGLP